MTDPHNNDSGFVPEPNTLVLEDQSLRYGFVQLPKQILWAKNISRDAKMLYAVLLGYAWQENHCYPGYPRLCEDMGASENMVRKYMRELEAVGLLRQKRRGQGRTNLYTLPDIRTAKIEVQEPHHSRPAKTEVQEPHFSAGPEPAKTEGKVETEEQDSDQYPSNLRKVKIDNGRGTKTAPASDTKARVRAKLARVRQSSPPSNGFVRPGELIGDDQDGKPADGRIYDEDRQVLVSYMTDLARELGDQAELTSTVSRTYNLMERSGLDLNAFIPKLYEARAKTQERTGSIKSRGSQKDGWGQQRKTKMPYFFGVLEDLLGLKSTRTPDRRQSQNTG